MKVELKVKPLIRDLKQLLQSLEEKVETDNKFIQEGNDKLEVENSNNQKSFDNWLATFKTQKDLEDWVRFNSFARESNISIRGCNRSYYKYDLTTLQDNVAHFIKAKALFIPSLYREGIVVRVGGNRILFNGGWEYSSTPRWELSEVPFQLSANIVELESLKVTPVECDLLEDIINQLEMIKRNNACVFLERYELELIQKVKQMIKEG